MNIRILLFALLCAVLALRATAAEPAKEETPAKQATKEEIEARLAEHHRKREAKIAADREAAEKAEAATKAEVAATAAPVAAAKKEAAAQPAPAATEAKTAKPAQEPAQVLPKVEVRRSRVTELDIELEKQNAQIAREKANAKPTALDETLNSPKLANALSIFGGQSSDDRANIAKERVAMMEDEKDILQAISQARNKEEKAELEKLLAQMRETRRELENTLK